MELENSSLSSQKYAIRPQQKDRPDFKFIQLSIMIITFSQDRVS
jgi:hypothetical protein